MKSRFAALFADGDAAETHEAQPKRKRTNHTLETDSPQTEGADKPDKKAAAPKPPDTFVDFDGLEVATTQTARRWALAIEDRHPQLFLRQITSVGHHVNTYGCWAIERAESGDRIRYADNTQLREMYEALGDSDKFWNLAYGVEQPGPFRLGKPPIDAKGNPLIENDPDRGDHGPLPDECAWIEAHDETFVRYAGSDPVWPTGCWEVNKSGYDRQLCDAAQIKYIAHEVLGMPKGWTDAKRANPKADLKAVRPAIASLFAEAPTPKPASRFSKLFN